MSRVIDFFLWNSVEIITFVINHVSKFISILASLFSISLLLEELDFSRIY